MNRHLAHGHISDIDSRHGKLGMSTEPYEVKFVYIQTVNLDWKLTIHQSTQEQDQVMN